MINWTFLHPKNLLIIGAIVLLTRFAFIKAVNAVDGRNSTDAP